MRATAPPLARRRDWALWRRCGYDAPWWILTTAGAWLAGLIVFFAVATPLWQPGQAVAVTIAVGVAAAILMAGTVAMVTGLAVQRLADRCSGYAQTLNAPSG